MKYRNELSQTHLFRYADVDLTKADEAAKFASVQASVDLLTALNLPLIGWVREATVLEFIPISKSTMWVWIKQGIFPAPTKIGPRVTAWSARSLRRYIDDPAQWTPEDLPSPITDEAAS